MNIDNLIGKNVEVIISEPEQFYLVNGEGPFISTIIYAKDDYLLLKLNDKLMFKDRAIMHLSGMLRHAGCSINDLFDDKEIIMNFIPILYDKENDSLSNEDLLVNASKWREGFLIGDLRLTKK